MVKTRFVALAVLASGGLMLAHSPVASALPEPTSQHAVSAIPRMSFELNRGQAGMHVDFLSRGEGYAVLVSATELRLSLSSRLSLWMNLVGSNPRANAKQLDDLPGKVNYLVGSDPSRWLTDIPTYGKIRYDGVYPGVDLIYYGNQQQLEYDFVVAPGVDPGVIALDFHGTGTLQVDATGSLVLRSPDGRSIGLKRPVCYQEVDGIRREVAVSYVLAGAGRVGFQLGPYDRARPLVIDPVVTYAAYLGGAGGEAGRGIVLDKAGNAYITGETSSTDLPNVALPHRGAMGSTDAFIAKLSADGRKLLSTTYLGGSGSDVGYSLTLDAAGNIYVTGDTTSKDFPLVKPVRRTLAGTADVFVAKLTPDGSRLLYSTYVGGTGGDRGQGIGVDAAGNAYVTGLTNSKDFPTSASAVQKQFGGGNADAFALKLTPDGSTLSYSTYLGGGNDRPDIGTGIAVDAAGNAYVTGFTNSRDFPTMKPMKEFVGPTDAFITKLDPSGALVYSTHLGGAADDEAMAIAVDAAGSAYVTGHTESVDFPTTSGAFRTKCVSIAVSFNLKNICSGGDIFVAKLKPDGSGLEYSTYVYGKAFEVGRGIAVDAAGNAYVTGLTNSVDFPVVSSLQNFGGGDFDSFLIKVNPSGSELTYATYLGGNNEDGAYSVALDAAGNVFVTGYTRSRDFPKKSSLSPALGGSSDAFVIKIEGDKKAK